MPAEASAAPPCRAASRPPLVRCVGGRAPTLLLPYTPFEICRNPARHGPPIPLVWHVIQGMARIPAGVGAPEFPADVMEHIQQQQGRPLEYSCKMADGGITADHHIEMRENAGGLHEPFGGVIGAAQVDHVWKRRKLGRRAWLQAVEPRPWHVERGRQRL